MRRSWKSKTVLLAAAAVLVATGAGLAVTRIVDPDDPAAFSSIQDAIDASAAGDTVSVRCNVYRENITMKDGVDLIGENPECTILDGDRAGPVVFMGNIDPPTRLSSFTIRNGLGLRGGGIRLEGGGPIISFNFIVGNEVIQDGTGYYGFGGGIGMYYSSPVITNNLISGNLAESSGGGIDMTTSYPEITSNTIVGNVAYLPGDEDAFGGGIFGFNSDAVITSNIITGNTAEGGAGGVQLLLASYFSVAYNDIFANSPSEWDLPAPPGPGHLAVDPLLQDPGSFPSCPRSHSPVLDAGPAAGTADPTDLPGRPRHIDSDQNGLAIIDMGACEGGEITNLSVAPGGVLDWDPGATGSTTYNLYRGLLSELWTSCATDCVYTQNLGAVPEATQQCGLATPGFTDTDVPPTGDGYFYLVSAEDTVEGILGFTRGGTVRDNDNPCP